MNKIERKTLIKKIILIFIFIVLYVVEMPLDKYIPGVEGVTLGLNNVIIMTALFAIGEPLAVIMIVIRILLSAFLSDAYIIYTAIGGIISLGVMYGAKKYIKDIGYAGISVLGALSYNLSIWVIACKLISNNILINNLPNVLVFSIIYGVITGVIAGLLISKIKESSDIGGNDE